MSAIQHDILLVTLPSWDMQVPQCAPAVLKGIAESYKYSLKVYDAQADLFTVFCKSDLGELAKLQSYFLSSAVENSVIDSYYQHVIDKIKTFNFKTLAFSVFSVHTHRATFELLSLIRQQLPMVKILVGGRGLTTRLFVNLSNKFTSGESLIDFGKILIKRKLVDYAIFGDGEDQLITFLKNQKEEKVSSTILTGVAQKQLDYPFSNFDDIDLDHYVGSGGFIKQLPVVSSKGCVRSCDFCDVAAQMGDFKSKDGARLAEEMIYLSTKYNKFNFSLSDSIINGNMKELRRTCQVLAEYNDSQCDEKKIKFSGNWICRPPGAIKSDFFKLLSRAGCSSLTIGAEHGSNRVLEAMDKKTNVEGLYYEIEQCYQNNIQAVSNIIVGHWSEFADDYLKLLEMILRLGPYYAAQTITALNVADFSLLRNTPAERHAEHNGIQTIPDANFTRLWWTDKNPNNTLKARIARKLILYYVVLKYGISLNNMTDDLYVFREFLNSELERTNDFFKNTIDFTKYKECETISWLDDIDLFTDNLVKTLYKTTEVELDLDAQHYNGAPGLNIYHNGQLIFSQLLDEGHNKLAFSLNNDYSCENQIKLELFNKLEFDAEVDSLGNLIKDKRIKFTSIKIDKKDILQDYDIFYKNTQYFDCGTTPTVSIDGLYKNNSYLSIDYSAPFWAWSLKHTKYRGMQSLSDNKTKSYELIDKIAEKLPLLKY